MAKTKRIKPGPDLPAIRSLEEADSALARIAGLSRHVALINLGLNESIAGLKLKAAAEAEPLTAEIEGLAQSLALFATQNKAELFSRRKSIALTFGVIGFRQATRLVTVGKATFKRVLQQLLDRALDQYIRTKPELDKEALKGAGPELLKALGCKVLVEDEFFCEPAEDDVAGTAGVSASGPGQAA